MTIIRSFLPVLLFAFSALTTAQVPKFVFTENLNDAFVLSQQSTVVPILTDSREDAGVLRTLGNLQNDFALVTDLRPELNKDVIPQSRQLIIVGTLGKNKFIETLIKEKKIDETLLSGKNEKFLIMTIPNPLPGVDEALVIAGSDKRGTIYGIYELSSQIGVSPWYYWADVPVVKQKDLYIKPGIYTDGEPAVRYRGIFLNDEAPALTGWSRKTFGGFNAKFYEHVFELILRLKGNFLWPAMWRPAAFYDDDPLNGALADEMGIIIGTTHHEPLGRAHDEWNRYGTGAWNYNTNPKVLDEFWKGGMERIKDYETVVTLGMRGDGDEAMNESADIALLEKIVRNQRNIITKVTGKKASETPQVWALYKEVQEYYDKGMKVPDDVTLLLCDDNWGNVRKLPDLNAKPRKGGYGMYYHFDYVGGPRNYKWLNVSQVQGIWEQMNITYEHGVDRLWVVNVGDLKPMEYPISFFLDMAWNPKRFNSKNLFEHTVKWCERQFGEKYAEEAARLINLYTKYSRRVTPEMLDDKTYSLENHNEFERVTEEFKDLLIDAMRLYYLIPAEHKDAFDQLVLFPINGMSNLYEMYYAVAKNKYYAARNDVSANYWADKVKYHYDHDSLITYHYGNVIAGGKWPHMMDQVRIGYTYWQQPDNSVMPEVTYVMPAETKKVFTEKDGYISIEAENFSRSNGSDEIKWEIIPDLGATKSAVTTFPQNKYPVSADNIYLEYDVVFETTGEFEVELVLSATLNFNANKGLRYAISFDGDEEQVINFNGHYRGELGKWQAESRIRTTTKHNIRERGKRTLRFRVLEPGIVLQKVMVNTGGLKASYLGAPQSLFN